MNICVAQLTANMFHYTSEQGVLGIFQKDKIVLQLTKADCMNDVSEGKEIFNYLEKVCKDLLSQKILNEGQYSDILAIKDNFSTTLPVAYFLSGIKKSSIDGEDNEEITDSYTSRFRSCDIYLMSFSKKNDLLPMWNYYATYGKQGYSIHFNGDQLSLLHEKKECYTEIVEVIYKDFQKYDIVKNIILSALSQPDYLTRIQDNLASYQYLFKNEAFEYEQEIRYLVGIPQKTEQKTFDIKFKTKNGSIIPYIELEFDNSRSFIVTGVTIGPFADVDLVQKNLQFYLEHQNHIASINIDTTNIPIRF